MKVLTDYLLFNTKKRQEFIRITDQIAAIVQKSGVAGEAGASGLDYHHHQTGEDNADAHLKRTIMGHQVVLPITNGDWIWARCFPWPRTSVTVIPATPT